LSITAIVVLDPATHALRVISQKQAAAGLDAAGKGETAPGDPLRHLPVE